MIYPPLFNSSLSSYSFINQERLTYEIKSDFYSDFLKDLEAILHSSYFRRLQGKTQVWGVQESDFFRTRLTHSLETAHLSRLIGRCLGFDDDLTYALGLAHDIGHPPFGHEGARVLDRFASSHSAGRVRFDDNAQNLRIICRLATSQDPRQEGLNLCASTIDGLIKYKKSCKSSCGWYPEEDSIVSWACQKCQTGSYRNPLASLLELADDLAYSCHDLEDAIRADMIRIESLEKALDSLKKPKAKLLIHSTLGELFTQIRLKSEPDALRLQRHKICQNLLSVLIQEVLTLISSSDFRISFYKPESHADANPFYQELEHVDEILTLLKQLVLERVIYSPNVQTLRLAGLSLMQSYLERFWPLINQPEQTLYRHALMSFPKDWQVKNSRVQSADERLRLLLDYVAGMSDQYLMNQASMFYNPLAYRAIENRK
jgi:dGTPase